MPAGRRSGRRQAVVILYQQDLLKLDAEQAIERARDGLLNEYAAQLVRGVAVNKASIDELVGSHLAVWSLDRLGVVERAILRVAAYELMQEPEVPVAVVVDEAVNLAKRYCSSEAGALVNGILGNVASAARSAVAGPGDTEAMT